MGDEGAGARPMTSSSSKDAHRVEDSLKLTELTALCTSLSSEVFTLSTTVRQLLQRQQEQDSEILELREEVSRLKARPPQLSVPPDVFTEGENATEVSDQHQSYAVQTQQELSTFQQELPQHGPSAEISQMDGHFTDPESSSSSEDDKKDDCYSHFSTYNSLAIVPFVGQVDASPPQHSNVLIPTPSCESSREGSPTHFLMLTTEPTSSTDSAATEVLEFEETNSISSNSTTEVCIEEGFEQVQSTPVYPSSPVQQLNSPLKKTLDRKGKRKLIIEESSDDDVPLNLRDYNPGTRVPLHVQEEVASKLQQEELLNVIDVSSNEEGWVNEELIREYEAARKNSEDDSLSVKAQEELRALLLQEAVEAGYTLPAEHQSWSLTKLQSELLTLESQQQFQLSSKRKKKKSVAQIRTEDRRYCLNFLKSKGYDGRRIGRMSLDNLRRLMGEELKKEKALGTPPMLPKSYKKTKAKRTKVQDQPKIVEPKSLLSASKLQDDAEPELLETSPVLSYQSESKRKHSEEGHSTIQPADNTEEITFWRYDELVNRHIIRRGNSEAKLYKSHHFTHFSIQDWYALIRLAKGMKNPHEEIISVNKCLHKWVREGLDVPQSKRRRQNTEGTEVIDSPSSIIKYWLYDGVRFIIRREDDSVTKFAQISEVLELPIADLKRMYEIGMPLNTTNRVCRRLMTELLKTIDPNYLKIIQDVPLVAHSQISEYEYVADRQAFKVTRVTGEVNWYSFDDLKKLSKSDLNDLKNLTLLNPSNNPAAEMIGRRIKLYGSKHWNKIKF